MSKRKGIRTQHIPKKFDPLIEKLPEDVREKRPLKFEHRDEHKMSVVLLYFMEPLLEYGESDEQLNNIIRLSVSAWKENPALYTWATTQRTRNSSNSKKQQLDKNQKQKLDELWFDWNPSDSKTKQMLSELLDYKQKYATCHVPENFQENQKLATWVKTRRMLKKNGALSVELIDDLDKLGFIWNPLESAWNEMYNRLYEFHKIHGHSNIPQSWNEDRLLATWVAAQRGRKSGKKGTLSDEQIALLDAIEFDWSPKQSVWKERYVSLCKFKKLHDHMNIPDNY